MVWLLLMPSLGLAEDVWTLDFPVRGCVPDQLHEQWLLFGGHSLARLAVASLTRDALTLDQRFDLDDSLISACLAVDDVDLVVAGSHDLESGMLGLCQPATHQYLWQHQDLAAPISSLCVVPGRILAGNDAGVVTAFDSHTGEPIWSRQLHSKMVTCMTTIAEDRCASADWAGKIMIFDATNGDELTNFQQHRDRVTALATGQDRSLPHLYSGSRDGTVRLWYPTQNRLVRFVQLDEPVTALVAMQDGQLLVATRDARLHWIDMNRSKIVTSFSSKLEYVTNLYMLTAEFVLAMDGRGTLSRIALPITPAADQ